MQERESNLDKRVVEGYAVIWGRKNEHNEKFIRGCFAKSIKENGPGSGSKYQIKFLYNHDQDEPLSLFETLEEDDQGLYFRTVPLDDVCRANQALIQLRSGTLNNFSQGFLPIWEAGKVEWDDAEQCVVYKEVTLWEISVVALPSDVGTYAIRSIEQIEALHDETDEFIKSLPRRQQLAARQLFARHQSLTQQEPLEQRAKALNGGEPATDGIDYAFLTQNFQL